MKSERLILYLLAGLNFTNIVDSMIMMPLGDIFMNLFDITPTQFAYLVSSYSTGAFISALFGVFLVDRFDRKTALIFIYSGFIIGTIGCACSNSYYTLLSVRFFTGLFGGMIGALVLSVVSDIFPFERRGSAMGVLMAAFSAAAALGVPLGLILTDLFDWHATFYFVAGVGFILLLLITFLMPTMTDHFKAVKERPGFVKTITNITTDSNQINALLLGFVLIMGHFLIIPFITPYMTRNVGFAQEEIKYIYLAGGILTVFTAPFFGNLVDRVGAMKVFAILMTISFIPVVWLTNLPATPIWVGLIVTSLFFIFGSGRMIAPQAMITASVGPKNRGSFMSIKAAMQQLAIAFASVVGGWIIVFDDAEKLQNYEWVGYLAIAVSILAILMATRLRVAEGN